MCLQKELANNSNCPHMCAYKLVTVEFKWLGLQGKMESFIQRVLCSFFIFVFCEKLWFFFKIYLYTVDVNFNEFPLKGNFCFELKYQTLLHCTLHDFYISPNNHRLISPLPPFLSHTYSLCPDGKAFVHPVSQTAVLLHRQMDWIYHGWHTTHGGRDKEGAGWGDWA